ncbi:MAG: hypothetical protein F2934_02160 [Actinobacteria bacterium]|uniref:Unannotated protein n=1 Tax=freshwater metagenome TaxID=449393 RepID=A0A6J6PAJ9_9ZZZZ|nr:hypothetical protein [Actinomycetota bacterium]MSY11643.1 hypothetical protein [Actinomycetota bacterium]MSZ02967.1 hypothetical protein [Actinomycetota bacterium]MTB05917.1 hypothetical protein [Actinomycetota bacterium]
MIERLAWVTAGEARGRDPDEPLVLALLTAAGVAVSVVDWDDDAVEWQGFDRAVIRSPWDYQDRAEDFLRWMTRVEHLTDLRNPVAPMRWSLDKRYLRELSEAGIPVIPTDVIGPDSVLRCPDVAWVVKPSVGAGSRDVVAYRPGQEEQAAVHVAGLHRRGVAALVQPLLESVARDGEWPMVFFGGRFSHTASKRVSLPDPRRPGGLFAMESNEPCRATPDQIAVAEQVMAYVHRLFGALTYARVDLVRNDVGGYLVLEVELVEPSLFLPEGGPDSVRRCAEALLG